MMKRLLIKRLVRLSQRQSIQPFQLCQKQFLSYNFSQSKADPPHNEQNKNPQKQAQVQGQQKSKPISSRQRLIQLKQQKRQQEYQQKLQQINVTTGNFNAFTQYLLLQKQKWIFMFIGAFATLLLIYDNSPFCYKTMGVVKDPFTGRKKFMVVNEYKEKTLEKTLIDIIEKQLTFWTLEQMKGDNSPVNKALQKKLQTVLSNLQKKYRITFKQFPKHQLNYQIAESAQTIVASVLGQDKLIISTKLLRLSPQTLQSLLFLMHSLHSRYLHVQNISFWQRMNLKSQSSNTKNIIKTEKTFISNTYNAHGIQQTIQLIAKKYGDNEDGQTFIKESISKAIMELFAVKKQSKMLAQFDLRNRLKNATQFIN